VLIMPSYRQAGTVVAGHTFSVPLDHDRPEGERIEIFAREIATADRASAGLPWLLFLQGGPGFGAPRPHGRDGWPAEFSVPTAQAIRGLKAWVTDEYEHDGLRTSSGAVLDRLLALARGAA
jgi:hypothetical protein